MDVQLGGVDDDVALLAHRSGHRALGGDAVEDRAVALQRVRPADGLEPADQRRVVRLEEEQPQLRPVAGRVRVAVLQLREQLAAAHVDDDRDAGEALVGVAGEVEQRPQHLRRQVVDDVPAEVLEGVAHRRAAGAGHAGDDEHGAGGAARRSTGAGGTASDVASVMTGGRLRSIGVRSAPAYPGTAASSSSTGSTAPRPLGVLAAAAGRRWCSRSTTAAASTRPKPGHVRDVLRGRPAQPGDRAEVLQQLLHPRLAEAGHLRELRADVPLAPGALVGDREAVRLVAQALHQEQRVAVPRQDHREVAVRLPELLEPLRDAGERDARRRPRPRARASPPRPAAGRRRRAGGSAGRRSGRPAARARTPRRPGARAGGAAPGRSSRCRRSCSATLNRRYWSFRGSPSSNTTIEATTSVPPRWETSKHSMRSGASSSPSASCRSAIACDRAVKSALRRVL